jgi:comEA protein
MKRLKSKTMATIVLSAFAVMSFFLSPVQAASKVTDQKININTASAGELQQLPRIGEKVAQRIIDFREQHGNFQKIEEIMKVKGIGERMFANLKELITVGSGEEDASGKRGATSSPRLRTGVAFFIHLKQVS